MRRGTARRHAVVVGALGAIAVAEGGEIVVSETTHERLVPLIECEDLGERTLKNVDRPMRLFRVA